MSRRIEIELTSAQDDGTWTWRAAGAKNPKGVLDGSVLPSDATIGKVLKVEVVQGIDGITVQSVVGGRQRSASSEVLELIGGADFDPIVVEAVIAGATVIDAGATITMEVTVQAVGLDEIISVGVLASLPLLSCPSGQSRSVSKHSAPTAMRCL